MHNVKIAALSGEAEALGVYNQWFESLIASMPGVHHYSWFNLSRKIKTYKNYWSKHWQSLYNIEQEDTSENNMFFGKPWSQVTDQEIDDLSERLKSETGGHVFHTLVDFDKPTPHVTIKRDQPGVMLDD